MKYDEQYLLNLSLQLIRQIGITHEAIRCTGYELTWHKRVKSPHEFYKDMCSSDNVFKAALQHKVMDMGSGTCGFIVGLGTFVESPYRAITMERIIKKDDLICFESGHQVLIDYATAVIAGCMWEILVTTRTYILGGESIQDGSMYVTPRKMLEFVDKVVKPFAKV